MDILSAPLLEAIEFSALAHEKQHRRNPIAEIPYASHTYAVALILERAGYSEEVVIAGLLHDVIEDTDYTYDDIHSRFGKKIADMVQGVTEDGTQPWTERKLAYIEHLKNQSDNVKAISAADLLANRLDYLKAFEAGIDATTTFSKGVTAQMYREMDERRMQIVRSSVDKRIIDQLDEVIRNIQKYI